MPPGLSMVVLLLMTEAVITIFRYMVERFRTAGM